MCFADSGECTMTHAADVDIDVGHEDIVTHCTHEERYRPAYELVDGNLERAGRASSQPMPESCIKPMA
jgi:FAD synthetase